VAVRLRHVLRRSRLVAPAVVPTRVSSRVKDPKSIFRKITRMKRDALRFDTARDVENHINDLAGDRLVCDYLSDVTFIHGYLQRHPAFKVLRGKKEDYIAHPGGGYRGVHLVVEIQTSVGRARCEIQLRMILQHAWAEKSHDLLYKLGKTYLRRVPMQIRNLMERQPVILYNIDMMALEIADLVRQSQRRASR